MIQSKPYFERRYPRVERVIAIIALINLALVFFDLTYLNLRSVYREYLPGITQLYDPVKGIEVHPETEYYQSQVDRLNDQLAQNELRSPQIEDSLSELRSLSQPLITERAFVAPNGEHAQTMLQQTIQSRTGQSFARGAFERFWSADYLEQQGWQPELAFWNTQIRPLFQTNYYRRLDQLGTTVDYFWLIDLPFVLIFAADILLRLLSMRRGNSDLTWSSAALQRWYDLFLLLPFWRWLRVIPVVFRLYQVDLLDPEPLRVEAQRNAIVTVGADLAGIAGIEIIEQMQDSIRQGELLDWLSSSIDPATDGIDGDSSSDQDSSTKVVAQDEIMAIFNRLYDVSVQNILPRIKPDVEELVQHNVSRTLKQIPGYPQLHHLPGLDQISSQVVQQLSNSVVQGVYRSMNFSDAEGTEIKDRLQRNLREAIVEELHQHNTPQEIQGRLLDVLDKFKFKYAKALTEAGGEKLAERTEILRKQIS